MSLNFKFILVIAQLCVMCTAKGLTTWDVFSPTSKPTETIPSDSNQLPSNWPCQALSPCQVGQYQKIPGVCKTDTLTEFKYSGYEYSEKTGHWYKFHGNPVVSWSDAMLACESEGARLAVPNSLEEAKVIMSLHARHANAEIVNTERPEWVSVGVFWDGNTWMTVDGQTLEESGYTTKGWKKYPDTDRNYPYVVMNRGGEYGTTRSVLYPYVCEKAHVKAVINIDYQ